MTLEFNNSFSIPPLNGGGGGGSSQWGSITGNINSQTDLMQELDSKQPTTTIFEGTNISVDKQEVNLPAEYKPIKYTYTVSRNAYIDTGINIPDAEDTYFEFYSTFIPTQHNSWSLFQAATSPTNIYGIVGNADNSIELRWGSDGIICTSAITRKVNHKYEISVQMGDGNASLEVTDLTIGESDFVEGTYTPTAINTNFCVWSAPNGFIAGQGGCYVESLSCYTSNKNINYIPCFNSSDVAGFYEQTSQEFKTKSGTGTIAGSIPLGRINYTINYNGKAFPTLETYLDADGGVWRYRKYSDNTFDAWYNNSSYKVAIEGTSGNMYRSEIQTLSLPEVIGSTSIHYADVICGHRSYPTVGCTATQDNNEVTWYAMSGSTRNRTGYLLNCHVQGTWA